MPVNPSRILFVFVLCCSIYSCKKENVAGPPGPGGPDGPAGDSTLNGSIFGKVFLYDSLGKPLTDYSNSTVLIENISPQASRTTGSDGSFIFPSVSSGVYNLSFSKPGFGTMKIFNFNHTGGINASQTGIITLGAKQSDWFDIKTLQVDTVNTGTWKYLHITITLVHPQFLPAPMVLLYLSHQAGTGNNSNDYVYRTNFFQADDSTLVYSAFDVDPSAFSDNLNGIDYLYIAAAIDNPGLFTYRDETGNRVYPASGNLSNEVKVNNILKR